METLEKDPQKSIKNLQHQEAIDKLTELIDSAGVCMFQTTLPSPPFNLRPMSPVKTDEEGNIWFFSHRASVKNKEISENPLVQLSFSNTGSNEFLSVAGKAEIIIDQQKFNELWSPIVKVWFPEGKEDPNLSLIKVQPTDSYYWDTKHNKMVAMIKMFASVVSGKTMDDGVEGSIKI